MPPTSHSLRGWPGIRVFCGLIVFIAQAFGLSLSDATPDPSTKARNTSHAIGRLKRLPPRTGHGQSAVRPQGSDPRAGLPIDVPEAP